MKIAETLQEEFELQLQQLNRLMSHGPSLGRFVELLFLNLLKKYFPTSLDFTSGFIQPMNPALDNGISPQIDILCYDRINYPIIFDCGEMIIIPPKAVKSCIEVKSTLTKSSLNQVIKLINCEAMKETPIEAKVYLIASKSKLSAKYVFNYFKEYYKTNKCISRSFGIIYCLDWKEFIKFELQQSNSVITYSMMRLQNFDYRISSVINYMLLDFYGIEIYHSIANMIAPSVYIPIESHTIFEGKV
ncbi:MAG: DUF6602 domain-containing protein [Tunicatimonas sp.]